MQIGVVFFRQDNCIIAYCPSLDLSGYGANAEDAKEDFKFIVSDYITEQMKNNTLKKDLLQHGWTLHEDKALEPTLVQMAMSNKHFEKITREQYEKRNIRLSQPCFA